MILDLLIRKSIKDDPLLTLKRGEEIEILDYEIHVDKLTSLPTVFVWIPEKGTKIRYRMEPGRHIKIEARQNPRTKTRVFIDDKGEIQIRFP